MERRSILHLESKNKPIPSNSPREILPAPEISRVGCHQLGQGVARVFPKLRHELRAMFIGSCRSNIEATRPADVSRRVPSPCHGRVSLLRSESRNEEPPAHRLGGSPKRCEWRAHPVWYPLPNPSQGFRLEVKPKCELDDACTGTLRSLNATNGAERSRIGHHVGHCVIHMVEKVRERALKAQLKSLCQTEVL